MSVGFTVGFAVASVVSLVLIIVSVATVSWVVIIENTNSINNTQRHVGLFQECTGNLCYSPENDLHIAVQVLSLISTLAQIAGAICHMINECHAKHPHLVKIIATLFSLAAGAMFTAMSIFTSIYHPKPESNFGFSFILGWVSFVASLVLAIIAVLQAVKEAKKVGALYKHGNTNTSEEGKL